MWAEGDKAVRGPVGRCLRVAARSPDGQPGRASQPPDSPPSQPASQGLSSLPQCQPDSKPASRQAGRQGRRGPHLEDGHPPLHVGPVHGDLAVEAARAQQRRVEHVGAVGCGQHDHACVALKAVHLCVGEGRGRGEKEGGRGGEARGGRARGRRGGIPAPRGRRWQRGGGAAGQAQRPVPQAPAPAPAIATAHP